MRKIIFFIAIPLLFSSRSMAQVPEDALRSSWTMPSGTARQQAIGGAMGSLGGEITAGFVNPAGLGLYKTNEFVISPGMSFLSTKGNYLGNSSTASTATNYNMGPTGLVFSYEGKNGGNNVFAIAVNRMANFNSNIYYKGQNKASSGAEQYAEEFAGSGETPDQALSDNTLTYGTRMALYTYLIDTATINGNMQVIAQPNKAGLLNQENRVQTKGGVTEIALSLASNSKDKWFFGATLGIPIMNYTRYRTYSESDATGNTNNDFDHYYYQETYTSKGFGFNAKLGLIYAPGNSWRFGFALHTPTIMGVTDRISASMLANTEGYTKYKTLSINSDSLDYMAGLAATNSANHIEYNMYTPWKFILSGSYVFGGREENVTRQKGFLTADLEYSTTNSTSFQAANTDDNGNSESSYYDAVNRTIRSYYKGTLGVRVGGELKFNTLMARAGFAYYTNPYSDSQLKGDRLNLTCGAGYRNGGLFFDLAYVQQFSRDVNFPYRLADKANVPATLKSIGGTIMFTAGIKF